MVDDLSLGTNDKLIVFAKKDSSTIHNYRHHIDILVKVKFSPYIHGKRPMDMQNDSGMHQISINFLIMEPKNSFGTQLQQNIYGTSLILIFQTQ